MRTRGLGIAAVLVSVSLGGTAAANVQYNGPALGGVTIEPNGYQTNGYQTNGYQTNGYQTNGIQVNGYQTNGYQTNGTLNLSLNGTYLQGSLVDSPMCAHSETAAGAPLPASCNACAGIVCNSDAHCCSTTWDSTCVSEAQSLCSITPQKLSNNGTLTATSTNSDGSTTHVTLQIASVTQSPYYVMKTVCQNKYDPDTCGDYVVNQPNSVNNPNRDVYLYAVNYWADSYVNGNGTRGAWRPTCQNDDGTPHLDFDGFANLSIPVAGAWENRVNAPGQMFTAPDGTPYTGGSKIPGSAASFISFACRDLGAVAKCLERNEYKPWKYAAAISDVTSASVPVSLDPVHQACVRMLRADYCGDGMPHTKNGTAIDVADALSSGGQHYDPSDTWLFEGLWQTTGAQCVSLPRYNTVDPITGMTAGLYMATNCPIVYGRSCGEVSSWYVDGSNNPVSAWMSDHSSSIVAPPPM